MEIPLKDTPALTLARQGLGGDADTGDLSACLDFLRVAKKTLQYFYMEFQARGISPGKYSVLTELLANPGTGLTPSELADRLGITRPSVTSLIDQLAEQDLVIRCADAEDGRRRSVQLTLRGDEFIRALLPEQFRAMTSLMQFDNDRQRTALARQLARIETELDRRTLNRAEK